MGISLIGSCSSYDRRRDRRDFCDESTEPQKLPNPNPSNFVIKRTSHIGKYLILEVNYPDCKNYEGNKILVYENVDIDTLRKQKTLDPHFSNNKKYHSPIARFEPTKRGWEWSRSFVLSLV